MTDPDIPIVEALVSAATDGRDFAGWLASVLAKAAAQLGSTDALLASRSGSWEAALVRQLLRGTVGEMDEVPSGYGSPDQTRSDKESGAR